MKSNLPNLSKRYAGISRFSITHEKSDSYKHNLLISALNLQSNTTKAYAARKQRLTAKSSFYRMDYEF
jgi:hypothetical protein